MPNSPADKRPPILLLRDDVGTIADSPNPLTPRADQVAAHDAIISALDAEIRRPLAIEPMAWGKSVLLALPATTLLSRGLRVLCLAHRKELLEQNSGVLRRLDPTIELGLCAVNLRSDNVTAPFIIGSTGTIYRRLHRIGQVDVDEAHLLGPGSSTMLARIRAALGDPPLVGVTATCYRTDRGLVADFLPVEHPSSGARLHASKKWHTLSRWRHIQAPATAVEADDRHRHGELRQPTRVLLEHDGRWLRIKAAEFPR